MKAGNRALTVFDRHKLWGDNDVEAFVKRWPRCVGRGMSVSDNSRKLSVRNGYLCRSRGFCTAISSSIMYSRYWMKGAMMGASASVLVLSLWKLTEFAWLRRGILLISRRYSLDASRDLLNQVGKVKRGRGTCELQGSRGTSDLTWAWVNAPFVDELASTSDISDSVSHRSRGVPGSSSEEVASIVVLARDLDGESNKTWTILQEVPT